MSDLVSPQRVRLLTGRPEDALSVPAVGEAVAQVEAALRRTLAEREVTEELVTRCLEDGRRVVYPTHRPATAVSSPEGATAGGAHIELPDGWAGRVTVTYTAGWTAATLPADLARVIAQVSAALANGAAGDQGFDPAVDSGSADGVSATLRDPGFAGLERMAPGCTPVLNRYRIDR